MSHLNHLSLYVSQVACFLPVSFFNVQIYFFGLTTGVKYNRKWRFSVESLEAIKDLVSGAKSVAYNEGVIFFIALRRCEKSGRI